MMISDRLRSPTISLYSSLSLYFSTFWRIAWQRETTWSAKLQKNINERLSDSIFMAYLPSILVQNQVMNYSIAMLSIVLLLLHTWKVSSSALLFSSASATSFAKRQAGTKLRKTSLTLTGNWRRALVHWEKLPANSNYSTSIKINSDLNTFILYACDSLLTSMRHKYDEFYLSQYKLISFLNIPIFSKERHAIVGVCYLGVFFSVSTQQQQIYTESMLDKYECFYKLSKSPECSIYSAFNRVAAQGVLMKRVKSRLSWNAMLAHKDIQLMNKIKVFPKMTEILKHKGQFFIVFEKPSGKSLSLTNPVEKIPQEGFYQLFAELMEGIKEIDSMHASPTIVPEWIYFHRNSLKVVHFQSFLDVEPTQRKHVFTYAMGSQNPQFEVPQEDQTDYTPDQYKRNLIFNLGVIAYRFLTGKKQEQIKQKQDYEAIIASIRDSCERQIIKTTGDSKLANFVAKMISDNYFEVPNLQTVCNFFQSRVREKQRNKPFKERCLDIQLEKIHIGQKVKGKTQTRKRKCCLKQQSIHNKIKKQKILDLKQKIGIRSEMQLLSSQRNKLFLPYISINRNNSCLNRHNPLFSTSTRKQHLKSYEFSREIDD